jgi:hypothetical protein
MRTKLRLNLDQLTVDSFTTEHTRRQSGTVHGQQCTCPTACTCPGCPTCDASCNGTCGDTCAASCYGTCGDSCDCSGWTCPGYCTGNEATCNNYGTCDPNRICPVTP